MIRTWVYGEIFNNVIKTRLQQSHRLMTNLPKENVENDKFSTNDDMPDLNINPYMREQRKCILCKLNIEPDYKNVRLLSQFQSRHTGRIYGKHITGLCKSKQEKLEHEILKAQNSGLMGYFTKNPKYVNDPQLFDPDNPLKPHNY